MTLTKCNCVHLSLVIHQQSRLSIFLCLLLTESNPIHFCIKVWNNSFLAVQILKQLSNPKCIWCLRMCADPWDEVKKTLLLRRERFNVTFAFTQIYFTTERIHTLLIPIIQKSSNKMGNFVRTNSCLVGWPNAETQLNARHSYHQFDNNS